ncbi:MAG: 1-(5-phosphoribosyl)-5-[(5-phosphoribosylamino)methylideneamino] imidazole-4-carboxamide isomerase [Xanthomonadales bacterium]|nr:1-(5-phosphoribosyl)-5-[(5-phosphoribosylamino)methylideneamino] imidazole-4-carboxamide isomerase [Xanthomonadales bacterium]NNL94990.1 1-(5-phosphoribosyl)-5-[(5-phosphoribosylamino)methylideneamino] imidazole-4-carboxamide isomerase [Xanthomonadales bacterium]
MQLIPAIDLLDGQCVRLLHGDFAQVTVYHDLALDLAETYATAGAEWLHVVDLAASRDGDGADSSALFELLNNAPQRVQTGGGVRAAGDIRERLENGAQRVVVGSVCVAEPERFSDWLEQFGASSLVAALDVQIDDNGVPWPRMYGWTEGANRNLWSLLDQLVAAGLVHVLCTDISRDGALSGPNTALYREILQRYSGLSLQASGGVSSLEDLASLVETGADGAICGKALLDGLFTVDEALAVLR